jgi:hypothetical protein
MRLLAWSENGPSSVFHSLKCTLARVAIASAFVLWASVGASSSGDSLVIWTAQAAELPATSNAEWGTVSADIVLNYDSGSTEEYVMFSGVLPRNYAGGGITVTAIWACAVNSGTVGWGVAIERFQDATDTLASDSFAAEATIAAETVAGTAEVASYSSVNISNGANMDSLAVGERFRLKVLRDTSADSAAGDARLLAVEIKEQ